MVMPSQNLLINDNLKKQHTNYQTEKNQPDSFKKLNSNEIEFLNIMDSFMKHCSHYGRNTV